jgi:trigger factor
MNTDIEHLADNTVRMTITIPADEFETSIDKAFKTLAREVRLPGFRPGKAPRQILEKHIGYEAGRAQALNDYLPQYYVDAVDENDVDPVDYPELKVTSGEEEGDVVFEATVAVRPVVTVAGYDKLEVEVEVDPINEETLQRQLDALRDRHASLEDVDGPVVKASFTTIDLSGSVDGEAVPGLTANDYLYEVGTGLIGEELDNQLIGKNKGDSFEFTDVLSENFGESAGQEVNFIVTVTNIQKKDLPEATDEWIKENTEFSNLQEYNEDARKKLENIRTMQAQMQVRNKIMEALAETVQEEISETFVEREVEARLNAMAQQSNATREQLDQYVESLDDDAKAEFNDSVRKDALTAIKSDLAIRAIILAEELDASDEDIEEEIQKYAAQSGEKINKIRNRIKRPGVEKQIRHDIATAKAVKLVSDAAKAKDTEGNEIALQIPGLDGDEMSMINDMISSISTEDAHDHDHDHDHSDPNHQH